MQMARAVRLTFPCAAITNGFTAPQLCRLLHETRHHHFALILRTSLIVTSYTLQPDMF